MQQLWKHHGISLIVWIIIAIAAIVTMPNVSSLVRQHGSVTLPSDMQSQVAQTIEKKASGNKNVRSLIVVFNKKNGKLSASDNRHITKAIHRVNNDKQLNITSITSANQNAQAKKELTSKDKSTQLAMINVEKGTAISKQANIIRNHVKTKGVRTYVTGSDLLNDDFSTVTQAGLKKTEIIAAIFIFIVLILVFRALPVPLISLLTVGLSYLISSNIVMNLAKAVSFPISNFTQIFMVVVLFGIGTDYNILLYNRFKEELANGLDATEAANTARQHAGRTILYSGSSVLIGFLVLGLAKFSFYQSAVGVAIGVIVLLAVLLTLNMFFMTTMGRAMFWPSKNLNAHGRNRLWEAISTGAMSHTVTAIIVLLVIFVPLVLTSSQKLNFNNADELPDTIESKAGYNLIQKHFPAGMSGTSTVYIESKNGLNNQKDLAAIDDLTDYLRAEPGVKTVTSVTQPGGSKIKALYLKSQLSQLVTGLNEANAGLKKVETGLNQANTQLSSASSSSSTSQLNELTAGTAKLQSGAQQLSSGVSTYTSGVNQMTSGTAQLTSGASQLSSSVSQLNKASQQLATGAIALNQQTIAVPTLHASTAQLATGSSQLSSGLGQLNSAVSPFASSSSQLSSGASQLTSSGTKLVSGAQSVASASTQVNTGVQEMSAKLKQVQSQTKQLQAGLTTANESLGKIGKGTATVNAYLKELQSSYVGNDFYMPKSQLSSSTFKPSMDAYMSSNRKIAEITVVLDHDPSSTKAANQLNQITSDVHAKLKHGTLKNDKVKIGGETSQTADLQKLANSDFKRTVVIMLVGIGIALMFVTRSLIQPMTIIGTLTVAYYSALSITKWLSATFLSQSLLTWNTPFFSFIMLIALGTDYSIFLMMRYRDDAGTIQDVRKRIINSSALIGTTVISAAIILGGTFAALMPSGVTTLIQVALAVIVGLILLVFMLPTIMPIMVKFTYPYVHDKMYDKDQKQRED
ncbi:hypothetical protein AYR62_09780 [Secundilactobacillus paracollinoides]|uniref:Membrane transport protein MMPL domain-containing protein n=2 Tax=Secundilactobacillus paracollinoides TaxID=240427 RepID=A0A1B2IYR6_9LACO|nr:MMPL family transporter [Secundilactobacillus paracollinoides]ANZ61270.1 hypothetical protein AYR61_07845 [Secundilactobacillus paracollinoides]ANZ64338.1 hypothetical protein AYR62_09780 [Secundilactobacillus paracollinoides]ANZ67192.1 hypothetical protein AYR63_08595 [Secundilactobacillus paracollinoides]KRL76195.1 RND superfamily resistance-nodulation-cell division proton (H+) antiporter [Secundilactobacillus paracollinoides DSM 15502 = JCM 11969]